MKRMKIKTIICHMAIIIIFMGVLCHGYIMGNSLSLGDRYVSYASADNWTACDTSDLVTAFRYYCKSRNLAIEGSSLDFITNVTTTDFNKIVHVLGIDPTRLQADIKKATDGNLGLRFLFNNNGVTAFNRIFAEFLQNNDLSVGDSVNNKNIYSGKSFNDGNGNSCLVYVVTAQGDQKDISNIVQYGSSYKYSSSYLYNNPGTYTFNINNRVYSVSFSVRDNQNQSMYWMNGCSGVQIRSLSNENTTSNINDNMSHCFYTVPQVSNTKNSVGQICNGDFTVFLYNNQLYLGSVSYFTGESYYNHHMSTVGIPILDSAGTTEDGDVYVNTTENTVINNNEYNNTWTIIYNDGDTYIDNDDPEPPASTPPGGGGDPGGGGGDNPTDPDDWNPTTPTIPGPSSPDFPSVELPDIDIPDLPSLNFSLGDLKEKFPFSLPFDIIAVLNVLDGEPQAPHIQATVPIGKWYTWEMDFDFSEFDNYARIFRAFEFIGFVIGLAVFTVHFAKG